MALISTKPLPLADRRKTPRPCAGVAPWERFFSKTGTRAGGWAGRPFPTAVRFLPLPASSAQHQAGRGAQGRLGWQERALGLVPPSTSRGARPPLAHSRRSQWRSPPPAALAFPRRGRGGVKLPQGPPLAGRVGARVGVGAARGAEPRAGAGRGRGGRGAGAGRRGAGPQRGERAGAAAAARPAGKSARRWRRPAGCGLLAAGPKSKWRERVRGAAQRRAWVLGATLGAEWVGGWGVCSPGRG